MISPNRNQNRNRTLPRRPFIRPKIHHLALSVRASQNRRHIWDFIPAKWLFRSKKTNREAKIARKILLLCHRYPQFFCLKHRLDSPEINRTGKALIDLYVSLLIAFQVVPLKKSFDFFSFDSSYTPRQLIQGFLQAAEEIERQGQNAQREGPYDHEIEITDVFKSGKMTLTFKDILSITPEKITRDILSELRKTDPAMNENTSLNPLQKNPQTLERFATYLLSRFQFLFDLNFLASTTCTELAPIIMKRLKYNIRRVFREVTQQKSTAKIHHVMIRPKNQKEVYFWLLTQRPNLSIMTDPDWIPLALSHLPPDFITGPLTQSASLGFLNLEDLDWMTNQMRTKEGLPASELKVHKSRVRIWKPSGLILF